MTGFLVSVLCAAAVGGGLATLMHQQKEAGLQHRLVLFDTKLTELTATVSMLTTMSTGTDTDTATATRLRHPIKMPFRLRNDYRLF